MAEAYRPNPDQIRLFAPLAREVREHPQDYLEAASWFDGEFSLSAIDARAEAEMLPMERDLRAERELAGFVYHKRQDRSGYMARLLRATEHLIELDDSALPKADRLKHYRRVVLVTVLLTDPDFQADVPVLAEALRMDRPHWPSAKALTVGGEEIELDRWWARDIVFGPDFEAYRTFEPLVARALEVVGSVHPAKQHDATTRTLATEPVWPATIGAHPSHSVTSPAVENRPAVHEPKAFDRARLGDTDRALLEELDRGRAEGKGRALKQLGTSCKRSEDAAFRAVQRLRKLGFVISNRRNGSGYHLESEPRE